MSKIKNSDKGFTIIEVVLVLAIAGLIFLIVFIALPQLQRSRRDTQRRSDLDRLVTTVDNYASNNSGRYPGLNNSGASIISWIQSYANDENLTDPSSGERYVDVDENSDFATSNFRVPGLSIAANADIADQEPGVVFLYSNRECDGDSVSSSGNKNIVLLMKLEQGQVCRESSE